jgi:hypothetical protein
MPGRDSPNAKREIDGRYARIHKPRKPPSPRHMIAQWVKAEAVRLQGLGMNFEQIAEELTRAGNGMGTASKDAHGRMQAAVKIDGLQFWPNYSITARACYGAWVTAINGRISLNVDQYRKVDNSRTEILFMSCQTGVMKGDAKLIGRALQICGHQARINGYLAPLKIEQLNKEPIPGGAELEKMLDYCTPEDQEALAAILRKARDAEAAAKPKPDEKGASPVGGGEAEPDEVLADGVAVTDESLSDEPDGEFTLT